MSAIFKHRYFVDDKAISVYNIKGINLKKLVMNEKVKIISADYSTYVVIPNFLHNFC